ncbi:radical SAM protein [Actinophytocola sp.]|uniref:radical SAM protein n=1 Tax=Actinophytocola sp. TaxID=1872138 RepID=UPI003D6C480A
MASPLTFLWLEITGKCQLGCAHCYADSGPRGSHGVMTTSDWCRVIDESTTLGIEMVQFIGGEPTMHPGLPHFVDHALGRGIEVEVYSNLVHVRPELWEAFTRPGVRLATSYYADSATQHAAITKRRGSHARTKSNIVEALRRSIPLRVGMVDVHDDQRVDEPAMSWSPWACGRSDTTGYGRSVAVSARKRPTSANSAETARPASWPCLRRVPSGRACSPAGCRSATYASNH